MLFKKGLFFDHRISQVLDRFNISLVLTKTERLGVLGHPLYIFSMKNK